MSEFALDRVEPDLARTKRGVVEGRWKWWYSAIADTMIRQPDWTIEQIAGSLNKSPSYLSLIINTDLFKEHLARRKAQWREDHDHAVRSKLTGVVTEGLDILLTQLKTKKDQIPMKMVVEVTTSALDRLGYAPQSGPAVVVNNNQDNRQQTVSVTPQDLEAARQAMRQVEASRSGTSLGAPCADVTLPSGAEAGFDALLDAIEDDDAVVMGEADPS